MQIKSINTRSNILQNAKNFSEKKKKKTKAVVTRDQRITMRFFSRMISSRDSALSCREYIKSRVLVLSINRYLSAVFFFSPSPYSRIFYRVNSFADTFIFRFDGPPFIDKYSIPEAANWFSVRHPPRFSFFQTHAGKIPKRLTTTKTRKGLRHFRDIDWSVIRDRKFSTLHVDRKKNRVYDEMDVFLFEIYIVLSCNEKMSEFSYN